jgi:OFA family oxalate/formate antiporter-like MFS transporter
MTTATTATATTATATTATAHTPPPPPPNRGWTVTLAGTGINLALGVLYTWSVISEGMPDAWGWTETEKALPYAVACLMFSVIMVPAGRMQDRMSPRLVATIGGVLVGLGLVLASRMTSPLGYIIGFGVLAGSGIGFGYASATPPAVKWFPAAKTGLIAGIVVSGFGMASVYTAPLAKWAIGQYGLPATVMGFGIGFLVIVTGLAQLLTPPPKGYVPAGTPPANPGTAAPQREDFTPGEILMTRQFYLLWFMLACGAGAGLMIISKLATMVEVQAGVTLGFVLVAVLAIGNGGGRIIAGTLSDRIGRQATLVICFVLQAVCIMLLALANEGNVLGSPAVMALISALIGANYGANLAIFPSITKDYYGLKNFGVNYGLVFTSWGLGGFMLALLAGKVYDSTQSFNFAYYCSATLLIVAAAVTLLVKPPQARSASQG